MHIKDHATAQGWFRKHAAAPSSKGSWKAFVARNKRAQQPRTMAQEPRMGLDDGGRIGFKENPLKNFDRKTRSPHKGITKVSKPISVSGNVKKITYLDKATGKKITVYKAVVQDSPKKINKKVKAGIEGNYKTQNIGEFSTLEEAENAVTTYRKDNPKKIPPPKGHPHDLAIKRAAYQEIKKGDPKSIYFKAQKKKTEIFPGEKSKTEQIHHGKKKSLPQTTEKWFLIDEKLNNLESMTKAETARDGLYAERNKIKKNKNYSISEKTRKLEEINAKLKRIIKSKAFKNSKVKGLVDITLETMGKDGKIISKDMGADISKSLGWNTKTGKLDLTKLKSGEGKKVLAELEEKLMAHLKSNPKLAIQIQKQLDEGIDITKILNSPAIKKGMPTWVKGELYFVAIDIMNNWTKGQSFWKGLGKGIETGTFGIADFNTDERALLSKGKKLVDQGVITQQEFDSMESWLKYTAALKKRRSSQNNLFSAAQDLKENNEQSDRTNILAGETAGWNTLEANVPDLEAAVESGYKKEAQSTEELDKIVDSYHSITDKSSMGYDTMSKVMDHLVGEEWSKTAGTVIDRGDRRNQGEGAIWGPIGGIISDVGNLAASPWLGLKDSNTLEQMKMNFQKNQAQKRIMEHPVYGFEEDKLKHPEAWEDITDDMDYAINPTEQLYKGGGIASLMKKKW